MKEFPMISLFRTVVAGIRKKGQGRSASPVARQFRPEVEGMEGRLLPSAAHLLHHVPHAHHGQHAHHGLPAVQGAGLGDTTGQQGLVPVQIDPVIPVQIDPVLHDIFPTNIPNLTGFNFTVQGVDPGYTPITLAIQSVNFDPLNPNEATFTAEFIEPLAQPFTGTLTQLDANTTQIKFSSPAIAGTAVPPGIEAVGTITHGSFPTGNHLGGGFRYWAIDYVSTLYGPDGQVQASEEYFGLAG
jgi:hypothetical protein